jgi:hypothetical protein
LEKFTDWTECALEEFTLDSYIFAVRGIPNDPDPQKRDRELYRTVTLMMESASTPDEKEQAYRFYKAYYENKPYTGDES